MNLSSCILISILVSSICTVIVSGEGANSKKKSAKKEEKHVPIDDLEGSGFEDSRTDTMVYSGSGYGPQGPEDDEDTSNYSPTDTATKVRTGIFTDEKNTNDANKDKDTNEQTLPMPVPKSTAAPTTSTKAPEPPVVEINTKVLQEQVEQVDIIPKIAIEQDPVDTKTSGSADKSPIDDTVSNNNGVYVINTPERDRTTSFFAQPGILAAVIGGAVVGLLCAILVVMFIVYRMRKKDEGSYPLEEMKRCPATNPYIKPNHREFFA